MLKLTHYILWSGISTEGHQLNKRFNGTLAQLEQHCSDHKITLLKYKLHQSIQGKHNKKQRTAQFILALSRLLKNKLPLITALELMQNEYQQKALGPYIENILISLYAGSQFTQALQKCQLSLSITQQSLIQAAEKNQQLPQTFEQLSEQIQRQQHIKKQLQKACIYPACVLGFTLLMTTGLLRFAVPQFQSIFASFNAELPLATQILIHTADFLKQHMLFIIFTSSLISAMPFILYRYHKASRHRLITLLFKLPWLGRLNHSRLIANWCQIISACLQNHLSITDSLQLANQGLVNSPYYKKSLTMQTQLHQGYALQQVINQLDLFNQHDLTLINMGIAAQSLSATCNQLSQKHACFITEQLDRLSKWIEPVIMLILALITGGLIVALYLPIFKIGSAL
jgi:type IV pilus assembly protein PilC